MVQDLWGYVRIPPGLVVLRSNYFFYSRLYVLIPTLITYEYTECDSLSGIDSKEGLWPATGLLFWGVCRDIEQLHSCSFTSVLKQFKNLSESWHKKGVLNSYYNLETFTATGKIHKSHITFTNFISFIWFVILQPRLIFLIFSLLSINLHYVSQRVADISLPNDAGTESLRVFIHSRWPGPQVRHWVMYILVFSSLKD